MSFTAVLPSSSSLDFRPFARRVRRVAGAVLAALAFIALVPARAEAAPQCDRITFTVALDGSSPANQDLVGWLCGHGHQQHRTLQVLLHGASYNHTYWDWPQDPAQYSYVRYATAAGFSTLNLDRVGAGISDHPLSDLLTTTASAFTIHQVIQAMRAGAHTDDGRPVQFDRIILVGHSLGSLITWLEAETYGDVDGVIVSGISHDSPVAPGNPDVFAALYPATSDPLFASSGMDPGYLTTLPGSRAGIFYYLPNSDPSVIAFDEATKDVLPLATTSDFFNGLPLTPTIHVPVLGVVGNFDVLACTGASCSSSGSFADEASFYSPDACFTPVVIPNAGHDLNLHRNAPLWFTIAQTWAAQRVGVRSNRPAPLPCP